MNPLKWAMIAFIKGWRLFISPIYGNVCRYWPSCSAYGLEAVQTHGAFKGGALTIARITRCNPWSAGGYDPVPGTPAHAQWLADQAAHDEERRAAAGPTPWADPSAGTIDDGTGPRTPADAVSTDPDKV